ncbi:MAG: hypothetical protein JSS66_16985 [Armatimonadetes bacterium]|nr:hypothetical protein [Armatimonadota bacterium]
MKRRNKPSKAVDRVREGVVGMSSPRAAMAYGFVGAAAFWALAQAGPAVAQTAKIFMVRLQDLTPGVKQTGHSNISGTSIAGQFVGGGAGLTGLNASSIDTGTVADARLSSNVALLNSPQTFTGTKSFSLGLTTSAFALTPGAAAGRVLTSDGAGNGSWQVSPAGMWVANGANISNTNTGNVGIGTTTPAEILTVQTPTNRYGLLHTDGTRTLATYIGGGGNGGYIGTKSNHSLHLFANDSGPLLTVNPNTNIGIGTLTPSSKLDIAAIGDGAQLLRLSTERPWVLRQSQTGANTGLQLYSTIGAKTFQITASGGTNVASFVADDADPRVGIGTATPSAGLESVSSTRSGLRGQTSTLSGSGVEGYASSTTGANFGGFFQADGATGCGVYGYASSFSGDNYGGIFSSNGATGRGVYGVSGGTSGVGVYGLGASTTGLAYGGYFKSNSSVGRGVFAWVPNSTNAALHGQADGANGIGVFGYSTSTGGGTPFGGYFKSDATSGRGIYALSAAQAGSFGYGVLGECYNGGWAVFALGHMGATGVKPFRIDHPDDPTNRYLLHYSSESPEVINFYRGNVVLNASGEALVELPGYFAKINKSPSYQLTPVGAAMPMLHVGTEIDEQALRVGEQAGPGVAAPICSFRIVGGVPGKKVSWRVEAVRNDKWVRKYGAPVEMDKEGNERGTYQHPELYNAPARMALSYRDNAEKGGGRP